MGIELRGEINRLVSVEPTCKPYNQLKQAGKVPKMLTSEGDYLLLLLLGKGKGKYNLRPILLVFNIPVF